MPLSDVATKYKIGRKTLDKRVKDGVLTKFSLPGSSLVFIDEAELISAFQPKSQKR